MAAIYNMLLAGAERFPESPAILAPGRSPLSYRRLCLQVEGVVAWLDAAGIGRSERVAIVLPNGPEMATAFLGVSAGFTSAPLNPNYREEDFAFYLADLKARALIVQRGADSAALAIARSLGIAIVELSPVYDAEAGIFTLNGDTLAGRVGANYAEPEDVALVLHTSGTTSRPKIVPLTQRNLGTSAENIASSLLLTGGDRCLNVMPLFHIHGLVGAMLASLRAGGSVICTPGFDGARFFGWMDEFRPSWYTAVPTMHQEILRRAPEATDIIARHRLRFIRSASAALPPPLMLELETVFDAPVTEAYGMTEASHQIACNPLPPRKRKPGSVGLATGCEAAIMDEGGALLPPGSTGEVVIRGPNITQGYEHNPAANAAAFTNGWCRTGDQGVIDEDGYLALTGRLKEIINRGGEKIAPREIDEVLLRHPDVQQAAAFGMRHETLGETVAAAVVLKEGKSLSEADLREFTLERLPEFKAPTRIVIVTEIPKGPTGKLQRNELANRLAQQLSVAYKPPAGSLEQLAATIFAQVLDTKLVGGNDNFFALGGDSIRAMQVVARLVKSLGVDIPMTALFHFPTAALLALELARLQQEPALDSDAEKAVGPSLQRTLRSGTLPLSFAQERLWFQDQFILNSEGYNVVSAIRFKGPLQPAILQRALDAVVARHETLRSSFTERGDRPIQVIAEKVTAALPLVELTEGTQAERETEAGRLAIQEAQFPFDLRIAPLFRSKLIRLDAGDHVLVNVFHHIVSDRWSAGVFVADLCACYEAFTQATFPKLPDLPIQYVDFADWQRQWLQGDRLEKQISYWKGRLSGKLPASELPTDRPRPAIQTHKGAKKSQVFPSRIFDALRSLMQQERVTLFMTLLAAFITFIHLYTGQEDILIGTDVAGRTRVESESLIGFFVNLLPIRAAVLANSTFREVLQRIRVTILEAYAHQDLPFDKLVAELNPRRDPGRNPLFQILFVMQNQPDYGCSLPGMTVSAFDVDSRTARFDLVVFVTGRDHQLTVTWNYNTDLFNDATIARMMGRYQTLLDRLAANADSRVNNMDIFDDTDTAQPTSQPKPRESRIGSLRTATRKPIALSRLKLVSTDYLAPDNKLPLVIRPDAADVDLPAWARDNLEFLEKELQKHGAILFRGFAVHSFSDFENFASAICPELFVDYGDLPREQVSGKIYDATPYPSDRPILFHNESSHMHQWPMKQWFFCVQAPQSGGETPIVDCRKLYQRIDPKIVSGFAHKGIMYVRNFTPDLDVRWQDFFKTEDRAAVESYCKNASLEMTWKDGNRLRIRHVSRAVTKHPKTGEMVWFNQAQLWHLSCLDAVTRDSLLALFGEEDLPRNCCYGDGSRIEDSVIDHISDVYRTTAVAFPWHERDILMMDNMLVAHSRNPYQGPRRIVVAMGEMMKLGDRNT